MSRRDFANASEAIAQARRFATESLHGVAPGVPEVVGLMVSELATNCVRHTSSEFSVEVEQTATQLTVRVSDSGPGEPALRSPGPNEPSGRGLRLVEDLSDAFGVEYAPPGNPRQKTVWFVLALGQRESVAAEDRRPAHVGVAPARVEPAPAAAEAGRGQNDEGDAENRTPDPPLGRCGPVSRRPVRRRARRPTAGARGAARACARAASTRASG
jgi:anti-sigma regulatory factor (Ser/Thr protein kinase)